MGTPVFPKVIVDQLGCSNGTIGTILSPFGPSLADFATCRHKNVHFPCTLDPYYHLELGTPANLHFLWFSSLRIAPQDA